MARSSSTSTAGAWALLSHNGKSARVVSPQTQSLLWGCWALATAAVCVAVPASSFPTLAAALQALLLSTALLPDDGSSAIPHCVGFTIPFIAFKGALYGGPWAWYTLAYTFIGFPLTDLVCGVDLSEKRAAAAAPGPFRAYTLLVAPVVLFTILLAAHVASSPAHALTTLETIGLGLGVGVFSGGVGMVAAHELCHRAQALEVLSGHALVAMVSYGHFAVEHTLGHHKRVATDEDPATARHGESFWAFVARAVAGELPSAWRLEKERLRARGLPWHRNQLLPSFLATALLYCLAHALYGTRGLLVVATQSAMAVLLFQSANYVEHYALEREAGPTGGHEAVQARHSWDSPARFTNQLLLNLQRHADHHTRPGARYQELSVVQGSPKLPAGYPTMVLVAMVPPLWRAVMHPRVEAHRRALPAQKWRHGPSPGKVGERPAGG